MTCLVWTILFFVVGLTSGHMMRGGGMMMMDQDEMMMNMGDGSGTMMMMGDCPFAVQVDGKDVEDGACIESPPQGVTAKPVWKDNDTADISRLLVWDTEAPCRGKDEVYIHFAGGDKTTTTTPMTAGAGTEVHTYQAAWFDTLPVPAGTTGCATLPASAVQGCHHKKAWKVARYETSCPDNDA